MCITDTFSLIFAGAAAFFTGVMCWLVYRQNKAISSLERAWIVIEKITFDQSWKEVQHFRPVLKNVGRSIARIDRISVGGVKPRQKNETLPTSPNFDGHSNINFVLAPGSKLPVPLLPEIPMNAENADSIKRGFLLCYIYGLIEYTDFDQKKRQTAFCWKFQPGLLGSEGEFYPFLEAPKGYIRAT